MRTSPTPVLPTLIVVVGALDCAWLEPPPPPPPQPARAAAVRATATGPRSVRARRSDAEHRKRGRGGHDRGTDRLPHGAPEAVAISSSLLPGLEWILKRSMTVAPPVVDTVLEHTMLFRQGIASGELPCHPHGPLTHDRCFGRWRA